MGNWFKTKGRIVYDPVRDGLKTKNTWWVIMEVDKGITDYYRWWANKHINPLGYTALDRRLHTWHRVTNGPEDLCVPTWGPHMSIIRGERPPEDKMHLWGKYHGQTVDLTYTNDLRFAGDTTGDRPPTFWFLDAKCEVGKTMREEFGFPSNWNFHITVGRTRQVG